MKAIALSLALSMVAAPAWAVECTAETPQGEPCDLGKDKPAPYTGVLTSADSWRVAAQKRMDLEAEVKRLSETPCASSRITGGLVAGVILVGVGVVLGIVIVK